VGIKIIKSTLLCLAIALSVAVIPAQPSYAVNRCGVDTDSDFLLFPTWNRGLDCDTTGGAEHVVVEDIPKFIWTVALNALDILLRIAGILAVVMLIVNGYQYLTSSGAPDKVAKAKTGLLRTIVGLALAVLASTIIYFVVDRI
jgi:hypothetical protein